MNSETLTKGAAKASPRASTATRAGAFERDRADDALQPWQLFTLAGLAAATAVVFASKDTSAAGVVLLSITVASSAWLGLAAWRTLAPLFGFQLAAQAEVLGGRTRAALEREKVLVLRAIKDLEFDRAMGKVSEKDFAEMGQRLRLRAADLLRQLDRGAGYRDQIERELARRMDAPAAGGANLVSGGARAAVGSAQAGAGATFNSAEARTCACGTSNDVDARFCKSCGSKLEAA